MESGACLEVARRVCCLMNETILGLTGGRARDSRWGKGKKGCDAMLCAMGGRQQAIRPCIPPYVFGQKEPGLSSAAGCSYVTGSVRKIRGARALST